jgi:hypothetical protein
MVDIQQPIVFVICCMNTNVTVLIISILITLRNSSAPCGARACMVTSTYKDISISASFEKRGGPSTSFRDYIKSAPYQGNIDPIKKSKMQTDRELLREKRE